MMECAVERGAQVKMDCTGSHQIIRGYCKSTKRKASSKIFAISLSLAGTKFRCMCGLWSHMQVVTYRQETSLQLETLSVVKFQESVNAVHPQQQM